MTLQSRLLIIILPIGIVTILLIWWLAFSAMFEHEKQRVAEMVSRDLALIGDGIWQLADSADATFDQSGILSTVRSIPLSHAQTAPTASGDLYLSSNNGTLQPLTGGDTTLLKTLIQYHSDDALHNLPLIDAVRWHERIAVHDAGSVLGIYQMPNGLNLISHTSRGRIFSEFSHMFSLLAFVIAFGTFGGIYTFLTLQREFILDPLLTVIKSAKHIGLSAYQSTNCLRRVLPRNDEIGELSRAVEATHQRLLDTISDLQASQVENERLAYLDNLTDLPNRRLFHKRAEQHLLAASQSGEHLALIFMDLDNFKNINDIHGHDAGDQLLLEVSHRLRTTLGYNVESDDEKIRLAARLGGDEFIFLVEAGPATDAEQQAAIVAQELLETVAQPMTLNNTEHRISASLGIALFPSHGQSIDALSICADTAMYEAKRRHKNGFAVYHESLLDALSERVTLENDLGKALGTDQLSLHYQPKYDIRSGSMVGAEALLRWNHPIRGNIPPGQFIGIAEESGLIHELGAWVIDEACRHWRAWQDAGLTLLQVAVNVSSRQFEREDLRQIILDALQRHGCPASALEIELTETGIIAASSDIRETLSKLRRDGISIAIDDFGTGYSSLSLISSMPVQTLKIDRSFITGMKASNSNGKIVTTLLHLAEQLSMKVVAEGIEEADELALLQSLSCDFGQGYFLSRPMSYEAMRDELARDTGPRTRAA